MSRYTARQKKKNILAKLVRRGKVGEKYTPREKTFSGIPKDSRGDLQNLLDEMYRQGLIEFHKGGDCISINRNNKSRVQEMLEGEIPDYLWKNF